MNKKFVYPASKKHEIFRHITRESPLKGSSYNINFELVPDEICRWKSLDLFGRKGGINLCHDGISCIGEHPGGPRLSYHGWGPLSEVGPVAFEPISYGVGVFREWVTRQRGAFAAVMGDGAIPKIVSKFGNSRLVLVKLGELTEEDKEGRPWMVERTIYESTNYIYGDSYGELEQIFNKRNNKQFLDTYISNLKRATKLKSHVCYSLSYLNGLEIISPEGMDLVPEILSVPWWNNHINSGNALWNKPPENRVELIERVDYLLKNTYIDDNPNFEVTDYNYMNLMEDHTLNGGRAPPLAS